MEALPDIYPLTGLQIGDIQSYISRAFLYFAPLSKKVFILVDNQPWLTTKQSRSARIWQFMVTKYRMSPFVNSRAPPHKEKERPSLAAAVAAAAAASAAAGGGGAGSRRETMRRWFAVADLSRALMHGFLVFEVSWRDVHGINYLNELLTDTSLALEARYMKKWEFYSAEQAAGCAHLWFLGRASESRALRGYLAALHARPADPTEHLEECGVALRRTCSSSSLTAVSEDDDDDPPPPDQHHHSGGSGSARARGYSSEVEYCSSPSSASARARRAARAGGESPFVAPAQYSDTLILFRFRDSLLPLKLRQIVMSDIRLLTLLESGLPSWVIFFQSYPLLCHLYRPWMRPLARSLYLLASLATVLIGFYDLYKNVPLLKSAAARICGPLFGWIERWDMVTRIQYLGTILFLRNLRRCLQSLVALLRTARAVLRAVAAPLAEAAGPMLAAGAQLGSLVAEGLAPAWALAVDLAEVVWAPFDLILDSVVGCLWPLMKVAVLPARFAAKLAGCAGTLMSATYNFSKDIWETMSSIFELNHMSEAQQSGFDMSQIKTLWNDLFSQIFRAIRGILNGILVFFASCNRHRLSIYNHAQARVRHMLRVARLAPSSCRCKHKGRRCPGQSNEDGSAVECDACK